MTFIDAVVSFSLANLCFLRVWDILLHSHERNYLGAKPLERHDYLAAILAVSLLAALLHVFITIARRHERRWMRAAATFLVLVVFILPIDFVRRSSGLPLEAFSDWRRYLLIFGGGVVLFFLAAFYRRKFFALLFWVLAILSPYAITNLGLSVIHIISPDRVCPRGQVDTPIAPDVAATNNRVIWVIFDEWDQSVVFDKRPAEVKLPALDALVKESVVALQAYAPAGETLRSVPALLSGRLVTQASVEVDSRLRVQYAGDPDWHNFAESENVVTDILRANKKAMVIGWYHPYDRILPQNPHLTAWSLGLPTVEGLRGDTVTGSVLAQFGFLASPVHSRLIMMNIFTNVHLRALNIVADPAVDFGFIHYCVPHTPGIYNVRKQTLSKTGSTSAKGYYANLHLVDRSLAELLAAIDRAGLRNRTTVILTSDHWWRSAPWLKEERDYRVPLIARVNGGGPAISVDSKLFTTSLRGIVRDLLQAKIMNNEAFSARLEAERLEGTIRYSRRFPELTK